MPLAIFIYLHLEEFKVPNFKTDRARIIQKLGMVDIKDVTPQMLIDFHRQMAEEASLKFTAREHLHRVICEIFRVATELGYITINPSFRTFKYEKKQLGNVKTVEIKEIKKFIKCLETENPKHRLFYSLIIATGLHRAEITALQWSDIDFKKKQVKGILLPKSIMEQLNNQKQDDGYIFAQPNGKAMCPSSFTYRLNLLRKKYKLENITMHKIQNTVCKMLETMDYKEMQRKVGL